MMVQSSYLPSKPHISISNSKIWESLVWIKKDKVNNLWTLKRIARIYYMCLVLSIIILLYAISFQDMDSNGSLQIPILSNVCLFTISPSPCSNIHTSLLGRILNTSLCPFCIQCLLSAKFSKLSFHIMCPNNLNCLFLILSVSIILFPFSLKLSC